MKDYNKLSDREKEEYNKIVTIQLAMGDVENILEFLSWAETTAKYLADLESIKGTPRAGIRLKTYAVLSNNLIELLTKHVLIGEPNYNKIN